MGNQMRPPKHLLNMGQAIVGTQVSRIMKAITPRHRGVFHFPLGSNRWDWKARKAVSTPNTKVVYPMMKIAVDVSVGRSRWFRSQLTWKRNHGQHPAVVGQDTVESCALY